MRATILIEVEVLKAELKLTDQEAKGLLKLAWESGRTAWGAYCLMVAG